MKTLFDKLKAYGDSDAYPFHMPGHKRNKSLLQEMYRGTPWSSYEIDITEIDGFDNLHHAEGILLEAQKRAACLYGARESFYLINGSTCGLLAAIFTCTKQHGAILMGRNCHKAVYHGAELRELETFYLYPEVNLQTQLNTVISPEEVKREFLLHPEVSAVLLTSPTYDGFVSDIRSIAQIVHSQGKYLIVDEAHGAHFGFSDYFPENSLKAGADIVIHSLHKTLPSLTQTALVSVSRESKADEKLLRKYLGIFETSSPSYVMMAGIDQCICYLMENQKWLFERFREHLEDFYQFAKTLQQIYVVREPHQDPSKLVIFAKGMTGQELAELLRRKYDLEVEMAARGYVIALTSIFDTREGFDRLKKALADIDKGLMEGAEEPEPGNTLVSLSGRRVLRISEAEAAKKKTILLSESAGKVSGEYLYLYPPGIPLIVPGEVIGRELIREVLELKELGFELQGLSDYTAGRIQIIDIK